LNAFSSGFAGIILAGGKSVRMGTDKSLVEIGGITLIGRVVKNIEPLCTGIIVSSGNQSLEFLGFRLVEDEYPDCGPMAGILSCLKMATDSWSLVISVDSPFVTRELILFLADQREDFDCVIPVHAHGMEPLIGFYHKRAVPVIQALIESGELKMNNLIRKLNTNYINIDEWLRNNRQLIANLNHPEDIPG